MTIRVLGCSGSIAAGSRTTSFLLDERVLIDAGTGVGDLTLAELSAVDHILISHSHLDHVLSIALLADSVMRVRTAAGRGPIRVHALADTLQTLRQHIFNGAIWPDFTRLPSAEAPILEFVPFAVGDRLDLAGRAIEVLPAAHTVPAVGFAVEGRTGWVVYTGDTGPNPALWQRLATMPLSDLIIETAFGDDERQLARISRHLCPAALGHELQHLRGPLNERINVHITHIKPGETGAVMSEIGRIATPHRVRELVAGAVIKLD
jgi:glyoxylase-like metal-dependent hydrolase (beta-lactamase superfamily II)